MLTTEELEQAAAMGRKRLTRHPVERVELHPGDRIWFAADEGAWNVRAASTDGRWVICTQPYIDPDPIDPDHRHTCLYTIIDFDSGIRGPDNYHGLGYETDRDIADNLAMFEDGRAEISVRYDTYLDIVRVDHTGGAT